MVPSSCENSSTFRLNSFFTLTIFKLEKNMFSFSSFLNSTLYSNMPEFNQYNLDITKKGNKISFMFDSTCLNLLNSFHLYLIESIPIY